MKRVFDLLEDTINKSTIHRFREFLDKYKDVTKWILCSDYCLDDKNKANRVITFVLYPYIFEFEQWQSFIQNMQKTDLKNTRSVSKEFCEFLNGGFVFSFSFILDEKSIFDLWKDKDTMKYVLNSYIDMTEKWQITTPNNSETYRVMNMRLKKLLSKSESKNFNYKLLGRIFTVTFFAGYIKYLLLKEHKNITLYSWLSDIDSITTWNEGICSDIYHISSHCLCENNLSDKIKKSVEEIYPVIDDNKIFYEQLNRVADFICGGIADFNYKNGTVTAEKHCNIIENIISDNDYIILVNISENSMATIKHKKVN